MANAAHRHLARLCEVLCLDYVQKLPALSYTLVTMFYNYPVRDLLCHTSSEIVFATAPDSDLTLTLVRSVLAIVWLVGSEEWTEVAGSPKLLHLWLLFWDTLSLVLQLSLQGHDHLLPVY